MHSITRDDGTKLLIDISSIKADKVVIILSGYGYSPNHPVLYFAKSVAKQNQYNTISIDFDYLNNSVFLALDSDNQDLYFDNDVKVLIEYLGRMEFTKRVFIGKSMGTTAMHCFIESGLINEKDDLVFITPGNKWKAISEHILLGKNRTLVIGSLADPKYTEINLDNIHNAKNVDFLEFTQENHCLEINQYANDLNVLLKVCNKINEFLNS